MLTSPLPPSFLDTYSLSMSSLGCNALCMGISFLVLWSICLSSSLVHFKKGPEYLTRETAQVFIPLWFIPLMWFLPHSYVSSTLRVLLRYSFLIFSFISTISILSVTCRLPLFITSMAHFSMPNSTPMSWLYILNTCIRVSRCFSLFCK